VEWLVYGANGYTGELMARHAASQGLRPILAGRSEAAVRLLAGELGLPHRAFGLDSGDALDAGLRGVGLVLHCAGPFSRTSRPMADACLRARAHYLDITGEIPVFESLAERDAEAWAAGVMLLPGVGFDVVASDCLAAHLKRRLPTATRLTLAFRAGRPSRGTATTIVENLHRGGVVRRGGRLTPVPSAWKTRAIDFGRGPRMAITIPWGDVSTAYHSTGIPDIEVYMAAPPGLRALARAARVLGPLLGWGPVQAFLKARIRAGAPGPSAEERARGRSDLWGEAADDAGHRVAARMVTPDGYTFTAQAAVAIARRVVAGGARPGFQTASRVFGPDFPLSLEAVSREDL
jgi:short subunit dehydrogenase-like uncharacterized protein